MTYTQKPWMTQLAVHRPLNETHLHDDLGPYPVSAYAWQADGPGKRGLSNLDLIQLRTEIEQQTRIKASPNLACKYKIPVVIIANQQRPEADSFSLRIREPTDNKLLSQLAFHFQPMW